MAPYIGQIKLFAFNFLPAGWLPCDGRELDITDFEPLYNYIGHAYGERDISKFRLPDLRAAVPIHRGRGTGLSNTYPPGRTSGAVQYAMKPQNLPIHSHTTVNPVNVLPPCSTAPADTASPVDPFLTVTPDVYSYSAVATAASCITALSTANVTVDSVGSAEPFLLMQPSLGLQYCICFQGIFPSN